uniref:Uncharacterized protein n=1 Tax=Manihot esculenta TaxID=3983 RepID=A0A2C9V3X6_MANES
MLMAHQGIKSTSTAADDWTTASTPHLLVFFSFAEATTKPPTKFLSSALSTILFLAPSSGPAPPLFSSPLCSIIPRTCISFLKIFSFVFFLFSSPLY